MRRRGCLICDRTGKFKIKIEIEIYLIFENIITIETFILVNKNQTVNSKIQFSKKNIVFQNQNADSGVVLVYKKSVQYLNNI